jgi:hypothetical protein
MMRRSLFLLCVLTLVMSPRAFSQAQAQSQPSTPELPADQDVRGQLSAESSKKVAAYVAFFLNQVKDGDPDKMAKGKAGILSGYQRYPSASYQTEYTRVLSAQLLPLLAPGKNEVKREAQICIGTLLPEMPQYTLQPALDALLKSPYPGARYWAIKAYRAAAKAIMVQGGDYAKDMLAVLEKTGLEDPCAGVAETVLLALMPYPDAKGQDAQALRLLQERIWTARLKDLYGGAAETASAFERATYLLVVDDADKKRLTQMLADTLATASKAYTYPELYKGDAAGAYKELMGAVEVKLIDVIGAQELNPIQGILGRDEKNPEQTATDIRLAVTDKWAAALKQRGITAKEAAVPAGLVAPATAPATKPASRPTTRP